jgi:hypothetical protein
MNTVRGDRLVHQPKADLMPDLHVKKRTFDLFDWLLERDV